MHVFDAAEIQVDICMDMQSAQSKHETISSLSAIPCCVRVHTHTHTHTHTLVFIHTHSY